MSQTLGAGPRAGSGGVLVEGVLAVVDGHVPLLAPGSDRHVGWRLDTFDPRGQTRAAAPVRVGAAVQCEVAAGGEVAEEAGDQEAGDG